MTTQPQGRIDAICLSKKKGERKTTVEEACLVTQRGFEGDAHAGDWHRQVSLLAAEDIATMKAKGLPDLKAGDFAENLVVSGLDLSRLGLGSRLRLGADVELTVSQLGKTCHSHCAIYHQTGDCIMPRLGIFARVEKGGSICKGDSVEIVECVPRAVLQIVVLTISDRCSRGEAEDTAGPGVAELLCTQLPSSIYRLEIIPDEREQIAERLRHYADGHSIDLVVAVGGTGFSPRDVTPEAVCDVIERPTPGLDEAMRASSMAKTPHAMLSRSVSGIRKQTLIVSTPGSERASRESIAAILPALGHGLAKMKGDASDCGR